MSAAFRAVREAWQMQCPKCRADDQIDVTAMIDVRLTPDGSDVDEAEDGTHRWNRNSPAKCCRCGYEGIAGEFAS